MSPEPPLPLPKAKVRRKLLRSMFAAPVLTTVASGSALAATSVTCVAKQTQSPVFPAVSTSTDKYLRILLAKLQNNTDASKVYYFVAGSTIQAIAGVQVEPTYKNSMIGKWRKFVVTTNSEDMTIALLGSQPSYTGWTYSTNSGRYAVLRFNSAGQVVGVGTSGTVGTSAITQSCMTSIAA